MVIQVLRNAMGGYKDQGITKVNNPTLLALRGGGGVKFPDKKRYVTFQWPLTYFS